MEAGGNYAEAVAGPSGEDGAHPQLPEVAREEEEAEAERDPWDVAVEREAELQMQKHKIGLVLRERYRIETKIGWGTYGAIYSARCVHDERHKVAVKFEMHTSGSKSSGEASTSHLLAEAEVYERLSGGAGIPRVWWTGEELGHNLMIMELLGPNLEQLHSFCDYRFSLPTIAHLARAMLRRLQWVHDAGYLHRDIKSANFLIGPSWESFGEVYLIDFGLAKAWRVEGADGSWSHSEYREGRSMVGTARYASANSHRGLELSRRDDVEALGYILASFALGTLPWWDIKAKSKKQRYRRMLHMKQEFLRSDRLAALPKAFGEVLRYAQRLAFAEAPDYDYLVSLFPASANCELDWIHLLKDSRRLSTWDVMFKWTQPRRICAPNDPAPSQPPFASQAAFHGPPAGFH